MNFKEMTDRRVHTPLRRWAKATLRGLAAASEEIRTEEEEWAACHDV